VRVHRLHRGECCVGEEELDAAGVIPGGGEGIEEPL